MPAKRGIARYAANIGFFILLLTVAISFVSDTYPEYRRCSEIADSLRMAALPEPAVGGGLGTALPSDLGGSLHEYLIRCNNVKNDLFVSYAMISVGVAFIIGGIVLAKED